MMLTGTRRWVAVAIVVIAGCDGRAADLEFGRYLATECMICHRSGSATSVIPDIFGKAEHYLTERIVAYRERRLPNPVMQNVAGRLTDEEIASLALYFATAKKP
jgi:cytochrome c553